MPTSSHLHSPRRGTPTGLRRWVVAGGIAVGIAVPAGLGPTMPGPLAASRFGIRGEVTRAGGDLMGPAGVILQVGLSDCGPAALANLIRQVGRTPPTLDSIQALAGTGPRGTRASGLAVAAGILGAPLTYGRVDPAALERLPTPFIAWVHQRHFVTVAHPLPDGRLQVLDPLVGRYAISPRGFQRFWSGEVLLPQAGPSPFAATPVATPSRPSP